MLGMNKKKKEKVKLDQGQEFNVNNLLYPKRIDPDKSLHTKQIQSSSYAKIDEN